MTEKSGYIFGHFFGLCPAHKESLEKDIRLTYNIDIKKAPTPKVDASRMENVLTDALHPVMQTGWGYFLSFLSRKVKSATIRTPKDMRSPSIPRTTIIIS